MTTTRYPLKRDRWVRPLLVLFTGTAGRSWAALGADGLVVRFGWYTTTVPYASIRSGSRTRWPIYAGLGWRTNFRSLLALVGSYQGVVKIQLEPPHSTRFMGISIGLRELYLSLDDPDEFLRALEARIVHQT